ncbi:MAG: glycosyltransferase [Ramlibacter sp.]
MKQTTPSTHPLVSVIVRSMDRSELARALESISVQTWPFLEVIVVNAKGPDHRELPAQCGPFPLRLVRGEVPLSRSQAANAGLRAAAGEFICFLDDDDWFEPQHLASLVQTLQGEPDAVAAYAGVSCIEADEATGELREVMRYNEAFDPARLLCENYLPIHSVLFRARSAARTEGFDESLAVFEDWDFWIQLSRLGAFTHAPRITASYRLGSGSSGLYGNTALQDRFAARILSKWAASLQPGDWAAVWNLCRNSLLARESQRRLIAQQQGEVVRLRQEVDRVENRLVAVHDGFSAEVRRLEGELTKVHEVFGAERARLEGELLAARGEVERLRQDADEAQLHRKRLEDALHGAMREYEQAAAMMRREQFTVLRPIARNLKQALRKVWRRLPAPAQQVARRLLGRPLPPQAQAARAAPVVAADSPADQWREALRGGTPGAFTVLVFPVIDWHFRIQRPQHLARELARQGHRVIYLSTTFANGSGPAASRLLESPAPNVHLVQLALPGTAPNIYEDLLSTEQAVLLAETLAWLQQTAELGSCVSMVNLPFWRSVATRLPANLVVYDCMDYHAGFSTNTGRMLEEEHGLLRDCDLLLTTSTRLASLMQEKAPDKPHALVRNAAEVEHFAVPPDTLKLQPDGRPVIGYFGAVSDWFDMPMVVAAARSRPDWRFVLVGSTFGCDVSEAKRVPNIEFVGEVPYQDLPGWVHAFDVCTIPFLINELTSCTNPVKVYEYLSAGKPVVATRMPELEAISDQVYLASDAGEFVTQLELALRDGRGESLAAARRLWVQDHTWGARAAALSRAIAGCLPKVSVVVLCYNNLALTQACLSTVEQRSFWPGLDLVVVDNASTDGTREYLRQFAATRPWVKLVLNDRNLGFAAGNNVGLAAASGEILVMLNNDTQVAPGWLHALWRHLARDPGLGMIGPVTNNIGNEAKIDVGYSDPAAMPEWAVPYTVRHSGQQTDCRVLAFFCAALRRRVYEEVGGLDESFGLGFFEDDDYCNRVRAAGWRLAIAEDAFVHHHLSASFDQLKAASRQALFDKNKAIYERKWGPWIPHQYRPARPDQ